MDEQIFIEGYENDAAFNGHSKRQSLQRMCFLLFVFVFAKRKQIQKYSQCQFVFGGRQRERFDAGDVSHENQFVVFHGTAIRRLSEVRTANTVVSFLDVSERLQLAKDAVCYYCRSNLKKYGLSMWLEYVCIENIICKMEGLESISLYDHFSRYGTWISLISKKRNVEYTISQHGTVIGIKDLKHKINASRVRVFNDTEADAFKNHIIVNPEECIFEIKPFVSTVHFVTIQKDPKKLYIAVVSQNRIENEVQMINKCLSIEDSEIYYLKRPDQNELSAICPERVISTDDKPLNIDCIITENSSLIYDYIYSGYEGIIISIGKVMDYSFLGSKVISVDDISELALSDIVSSISK